MREIFDGVGGKLIAEIVVFVVCVPLNFDKIYLMYTRQSQQLLPQIIVQHGLIVSFLPSGFFPRVYPAVVESIDGISRIAVYIHLARLF